MKLKCLLFGHKWKAIHFFGKSGNAFLCECMLCGKRGIKHDKLCKLLF